MKLDDRDIVCETDLSDHEFEAALDAAIETGNPDARVKVVEMYYESRMETAYAYQRATSADSRFEVTYADNRAALARAETAEAEARDARNDLDDAELHLRRAEAAATALAARVAELEAQLAAQGWRPVTEDWPPYDKCVPVRMRNGAIRWGFRRGDFWHLTVGKYGREGVTHAYVLPPAPQETP